MQSSTAKEHVPHAELFKTSRLPKTLQDAMLATQKLDLDHLWTQSMCLVQKDECARSKSLQMVETITWSISGDSLKRSSLNISIEIHIYTSSIPP
jgi:hypothetical protein